MNRLKPFLIIAILGAFICFSTHGKAQTQKRRGYTSLSMEMIFSFASLEHDTMNMNNKVRWSPVLNLQFLYSFDMTKNFGLFTGIALRNVGFIWKDDFGGKTKQRVYALGLPVGIKLGNVKKGLFVYVGGQIEYAFNYKEKYFINDTKTKGVYWFTNRVNPMQLSLLAGFNLPYGFNVKFKYYFTDLMNRDYEEFNSSGVKYKPYEHVAKSQIIYFSISFNMFHRDYEYFDDDF